MNPKGDNRPLPMFEGPHPNLNSGNQKRSLELLPSPGTPATPSSQVCGGKEAARRPLLGFPFKTSTRQFSEKHLQRGAKLKPPFHASPPSPSGNMWTSKDARKGHHLEHLRLKLPPYEPEGGKSTLANAFDRPSDFRHGDFLGFPI